MVKITLYFKVSLKKENVLITTTITTTEESSIKCDNKLQFFFRFKSKLQILFHTISPIHYPILNHYS